MFRRIARLAVAAALILCPAAVFGATSYDGDGTADMPLYDATTGTWRVLTSVSNYRSSFVVYWGGPEYTPVPADYDGDGRIDIAVYDAGRGIWWVLTSSSHFQSAFAQYFGGPAYSPVPGDYDGDGRADLAVMRAGLLSVLPSSAPGTTRAYAVGTAGDEPVRGDFDGDHIADAAVYRPSTGAWRILTSSSNFVGLVAITLGGPGYVPVAGDYDHDGRTDPAVYNVASGDWAILRSTSNTTARIAWGGTGYAPVPGDYDGDGLNDLAVYAAAVNEWFVLESSTGFTTVLRVVWGQPIDEVVTSLPVRTTWNDALRATDFDGDGASDIAVYEPASGTWTILTSSSRFTLTRTIVWGGAAGDVPVPGDYDGDGITDPPVFNAGAGTWKILRSLRGPLTVAVGLPGVGPMFAVPGDYDGDGITDVAVQFDDTWLQYASSKNFTTFLFPPGGPLGGPPRLIPVPADYTGDGKTDVAAYQVGDDWWGVPPSIDRPGFILHWGGAAYSPIPADYDGDGKADLAVCVKAAGDCYVLKTGFQFTTAFTLPWGHAIDTLFAGDYDGDGIADMASYNPATGGWSLRLSSSGFTFEMQRTLGGPGYVPAR